MVEEWNAREFEKRISQRDRMAVVEFYTDWCPGCKTMTTILDQTSKEFREISFGRVNVEEEKALMNEYGVRSVPTLMVFRRGKSVAESVGTMGKGRVAEWIRNTL